MTSPSEFGAGDEWKRRLLVTPTREARPLLANALIALREAPAWKGVVAYDEFALVTMSMEAPPWAMHNHNSWSPRIWTDHDDTLVTEWLQQHGIRVNPPTAAKAIEAVAKERAFHPIRNYLAGLKWDGTNRVESFAHQYLGAEDTAYHRAVSRCTLVSAVARVFEPGCKADHATILEGEQGALKSTAIEAIFSPWFSDDLAELGTKDAAMQTRVAWGIEIAELASMQRSEVEKIKAFITRKVDIFRPPYGARVLQVPRQSIFIGSTNAGAYIKDETGGRRFWPIACGAINIAAIKSHKDQLWAEAAHLYHKGTRWWLEGKDDIRAAKEQQEERRVTDEWENLVAAFVTGREDVTIGEILSEVFFIEKAKWTQPDQNRVARCLVALGWKRGWRYAERCYRPG